MPDSDLVGAIVAIVNGDLGITKILAEKMDLEHSLITGALACSLGNFEVM